MRRGESGLSGLIAIDKPAGMTSHDVVDRVRRIYGERRCGHAGTLDPAATGLLLVAVGPATRLCSQVGDQGKSYLAHIVFGTATDTDDAQGAGRSGDGGHHTQTPGDARRERVYHV